MADDTADGAHKQQAEQGTTSPIVKPLAQAQITGRKATISESEDREFIDGESELLIQQTTSKVRTGNAHGTLSTKSLYPILPGREIALPMLPRCSLPALLLLSLKWLCFLSSPDAVSHVHQFGVYIMYIYLYAVL